MAVREFLTMIVRTGVAPSAQTIFYVSGIDGRTYHVQVHSGHVELINTETRIIYKNNNNNEIRMEKNEIVGRYRFYASLEFRLDVHLFGDFHLVRIVAADEQVGFQIQSVHVTVFDGSNRCFAVDGQFVLLRIRVPANDDRRPFADFQILMASQQRGYT